MAPKRKRTLSKSSSTDPKTECEETSVNVAPSLKRRIIDDKEKAVKRSNEDNSISSSTSGYCDPWCTEQPEELLDVNSNVVPLKPMKPLCNFLPNSFFPDISTLVEGEPGTSTGRPMRLYADGIFDLFHYGHAKALEQAKKSFPNAYLIVGCCSDASTHRYKGRTVLKDTQRYESLRHCKWVDEVVEDAPWVITDQFLERYSIDFVCHDALPYTDASGVSNDGDVYTHLKKAGRFIATKRTEGVSTSDIITSIIQDYDEFVRRNLRRGYSAKDMNVSFLKEQSIKFGMVREKVAKNIGKLIKENSHTNALAEDLQKAFVSFFNRNSTFRMRLRNRRKEIKRKLRTLAKNSIC